MARAKWADRFLRYVQDLFEAYGLDSTTERELPNHSDIDFQAFKIKPNLEPRLYMKPSIFEKFNFDFIAEIKTGEEGKKLINNLLKKKRTGEVNKLIKNYKEINDGKGVLFLIIVDQPIIRQYHPSLVIPIRDIDKEAHKDSLFFIIDIGRYHMYLMKTFIWLLYEESLKQTVHTERKLRVFDKNKLIDSVQKSKNYESMKTYEDVTYLFTESHKRQGSSYVTFDIFVDIDDPINKQTLIEISNNFFLNLIHMFKDGALKDRKDGHFFCDIKFHIISYDDREPRVFQDNLRKVLENSYKEYFLDSIDKIKKTVKEFNPTFELNFGELAVFDYDGPGSVGAWVSPESIFYYRPKYS